jgi:hypothetical protein
MGILDNLEAYIEYIDQDKNKPNEPKSDKEKQDAIWATQISFEE